jgi:isoquinoline 1-oxidoreductase alpha subunit
MITITLNGREQSFDVEPDMPLLWLIREEAGLRGTKFGCGIAQCGACTIHVDGQAVRSCRPAVSTKRLSLTCNGQVRYELKTPWHNGTR